MKNTFISFRLPEQLAERITTAADAEMLSVSDICRRSVLDGVRAIEVQHGLINPTEAPQAS